MRVTLHRQKAPTFATPEEHDRYYRFVVVRPLATCAADILGRYHSRQEAERAAEQQFSETATEVMTAEALRKLSD